MLQGVFKFGDFTRAGEEVVRSGSACGDTPPEGTASEPCPAWRAPCPPGNRHCSTVVRGRGHCPLRTGVGQTSRVTALWDFGVAADPGDSPVS